MHRNLYTFCVIFVIIAVFSLSVSGRPTNKLQRQKRQSDQRLAELETLLALQKYRHHRLRPEHKGSQPGFGVIDFNTIGRRKKSTRFSSGEPSLSHVFPEEAFEQAATKLGEEKESPVAEVDPTLNEKISNALSYQSLRIRRDQGQHQDAPQQLDVNEEKK